MKYFHSQKKISPLLLASSLALPLVLFAPQQATGEEKLGGDSRPLVAKLYPTNGSQAYGTVVFTATGPDQVTVTARVRGLRPNALHAIHIHEFGDLSAPDGTSAGSHFNPDGKPHGLPGDGERHAGDLGNLVSDAEGEAIHVRNYEGISLDRGENAILGRALVVHDGQDRGTQPAGDAGSRIAVGVIGIANPERLVTRETVSGSSVRVWKDDDGFFKKAGEKLDVWSQKAEEAIGKAARKTGEGIEKAVEKAEEKIEDLVE